jgi:hypothetical protein
MSNELDDLFDDLSPAERARLQHAHDLLLAAGPMPELPPELEEPMAPPTADIIPYFPKRRYAAGALAAAASVAAAFGVGFLVGHHKTGGSFVAAKVVRMHATAAAPRALASITLGKHDAAGNWPMLVKVTNLAKLPPGGYYTLWLTRKGKAVAPCGSFHAQGTSSTMTFTVAYSLTQFDGWVVTKTMPGHHATAAETGTPVLTT